MPMANKNHEDRRNGRRLHARVLRRSVYEQCLKSKPRVERVRVQQLRSRGLGGLGDALGEHILSLAWLSAGGNRWRGVIEHLHDQLGHRVELISAESASRQRRRTDPYARGVPGAVWIGGYCIPVGDNPRIQ